MLQCRTARPLQYKHFFLTSYQKYLSFSARQEGRVLESLGRFHVEDGLPRGTRQILDRLAREKHVTHGRWPCIMQSPLPSLATTIDNHNLVNDLVIMNNTHGMILAIVN